MNVKLIAGIGAGIIALAGVALLALSGGDEPAPKKDTRFKPGNKPSKRKAKRKAKVEPPAPPPPPPKPEKEEKAA